MSNFARGYINGPIVIAGNVLSVVDGQPLSLPAGAIIKNVWIHAVSPLSTIFPLSIGVVGDIASIVPIFSHIDLNAVDLGFALSSMINAQSITNTIVVGCLSLSIGEMYIVIEWNYFMDI
jgi:hypothetical protein